MNNVDSKDDMMQIEVTGQFNFERCQMGLAAHVIHSDTAVTIL